MKKLILTVILLALLLSTGSSWPDHQKVTGEEGWVNPIEITCFISIDLVGGSRKPYIGEKNGVVSIAVFTDEYLRNRWRTYNFSDRPLKVPVDSWIVVFFDEESPGVKVKGWVIVDVLTEGDSYAPESSIQIACDQGKTVVVPITPFGDDYLWEFPPLEGRVILTDILPDKKKEEDKK